MSATLNTMTFPCPGCHGDWLVSSPRSANADRLEMTDFSGIAFCNDFGGDDGVASPCCNDTRTAPLPGPAWVGFSATTARRSGGPRNQACKPVKAGEKR